MCSSPKTSHKKLSSTTLRRTQLNSREQSDFATKANLSWELRELRRQQRKALTTASTKEPIAATEQSSALQRLWHMLFRSDTTPPTNRSHSAQ